MDLNYICPKPIKWNAIYEKLLAYWGTRNNEIPKPPIPLILAGWAYSTDLEKKIRWNETLDWINQYYFNSEIIKLADEDKYM